MTAVTADYFSRYEISGPELEEMYNVFRRYYRNTEVKTFKNDLDKKNGAFILRDKKTRKIVGFSTILEMKMKINGKRVLGIFSGDTIIEEEYWGNNPLNSMMVKFLLKKLITHPFTPVYWFLISKGYKTYLLLANNFLHYYPHFKREDKQLRDVAEAYSRYLFSDYYNDKKRIIDFGKDYQSLKGGVAEITGEMCERYPKIAFFNEKNPTWDRGTELPCVGRVDWSGIFNRVLIKPFKNPVKRFVNSMTPNAAIQNLASQRKAL
jgi:hypothetical protein